VKDWYLPNSSETDEDGVKVMTDGVGKLVTLVAFPEEQPPNPNIRTKTRTVNPATEANLPMHPPRVHIVQVDASHVRAGKLSV
jgi:hypothetical protein